MNLENNIRRRKFLRRTSSALGTMALLGGSSSEMTAAERLSDPKKREAADKVLAEMEAKGGKFLSVPRKDGEFLNLLVKATRSKNILEIGTSHGYSSLWMSLGLEETDGHLTTIEILPERVKLARDHVARAGLAHRVTFKEGDAHALVPALEGTFDFVLLDADKEGQLDYFQKLYPKKLLAGGILMAHNAIKYRELMKDYLEALSQHRDFDSMVVSITMDDGFSLSYRKRQA